MQIGKLGLRPGLRFEGDDYMDKKTLSPRFAGDYDFFGDRSTVLVKKVNKAATYDWSRGVASWSGDVKPERAGPVKLQAGDVDALLMNLALVRDVAAGKPLKYRMVDDGRVKPMNYSVAGKESVQVGGQAQQATKLVSTNGDRQTIIWVVDGMPVPARIQQREDGKATIDLRVQSVN